jgi:hypothetical protein
VTGSPSQSRSVAVDVMTFDELDCAVNSNDDVIFQIPACVPLARGVLSCCVRATCFVMFQEHTYGCIEAIAIVDVLVIAGKETGGCWTVEVFQLTIQTVRISMTSPPSIEYDAVLSQSREQLRLSAPHYGVVLSLVHTRLTETFRCADRNDFVHFTCREI